MVAHYRGTLFRHISSGVCFFYGGIVLKETVCCFFGHRDTPDDIKDKLRQEVRFLIIKENARKFYVGNQGHFDYMAFTVLREMKSEFPVIDYAVVLAYMPDRPVYEYSYFKPEESLFPDGLEKVPRKYGILWRNDWMIKKADTVICYVNHYFCGAGSMIEKAQKKGKRIINLAQNPHFLRKLKTGRC